MKLIIDIPDYELEKVKNGSIASGIILKAVKNATPITDGDLISRSVAINLLNEAQVEFDEYYKGLGKAKTIIDNAPTVEPICNQIAWEQGYEAGLAQGKSERPQGEWKYTTHYARRYRVCPICTAEKEDDRSAGWNFCWHCGADMRKGGAE